MSTKVIPELQYVNAKTLLDWYMEKLEKDDTAESKWALQYATMQIARLRAESFLSALYSYPMNIEEK